MKHQTSEYAIWSAMKKFAAHETLTDQEWEALSWLTLVDHSQGFGPKNTRWAATAAERESNLKLYKSLGEQQCGWK